MTIPEVKPGDPVLYTADICHACDRDARGNYVFAFQHVKNGPIRGGELTAKAGEPVTHFPALGKFEKRYLATHHIETAGGHTIKPTRPLAAWRAVVTAVHEGGKCDLEIQHPHGHVLGYPNVPYAADGSLHSWCPLVEGV